MRTLRCSPLLLAGTLGAATFVIAWVALPHPFLPIMAAGGLAAIGIAALVVTQWPILTVLLSISVNGFRLPEVFPILLPLRLQFIASVLLLGAFVWEVLRRRSIAMPLEMKLVVAFFLVCATSMVYAISPGAALQELSRFGKVIILSIAIVPLFRVRSDYKLCVWILVGVGCAIGGVAISNRLSGAGVVEGTRAIAASAPSILADPNEVALNLLLPLACSLCVLTMQRTGRLLAAVSSALMIVAIIFTQSRGGFLGLCVVLLPFAAKLFRFRLAAIIAGAIALATLFSWMDLSSRPNVKDPFALDVSAETRLELWILGVNITLSNPLLGVGIGNFPLAALAATGRSWNPHNIWIQVSAETGLIGLAVFMFLLLAAFKSARDTLRKISQVEEARDCVLLLRSTLLALPGICIASTFLSEAYLWPLYTTLALIAAARWCAFSPCYEDPRK